MKILLLYDCLYPDSLGGVEHRNRELARELALRGHRVTLAGWSMREVTAPRGVQLLSLPLPRAVHAGSGRRSLLAATRLAIAAGTVRPAEFDLIETANIPYLHLAPLAACCRLARRPLLVSWYEYWGAYWRDYLPMLGRPASTVERWCARLGTEVNAVSYLTANRLGQARGGDVPLVVPAGVSVEQVQGAARQGIFDAPLVYAGRLHREKRLGLLLASIRELRLEVPKTLLKIIGSGPDETRLRELADSLGIAERVQFLGRVEENRDVWRELGGSQIAVQPSEREGFGMFPLEAMAAGLPVVYCRSAESAVGELVRDGVEGFCVDPEPTRMARALHTLLGDFQLRNSMSLAARARAAEFDWSHVATRFEGLAKEIVGQSE